MFQFRIFSTLEKCELCCSKHLQVILWKKSCVSCGKARWASRYGCCLWWEDKPLVCHSVRGVRGSSLGEPQRGGPTAGNCPPQAWVSVLPSAHPFRDDTRLVDRKCSSCVLSAEFLQSHFCFPGFSTVLCLLICGPWVPFVQTLRASPPALPS